MKIGFAGTDGRTLISAIVVATAKSDLGSEKFEGVVIRGTSAMPEFARIFNWPISFIPTQDNSVTSYSASIVNGFLSGRLDYVIPMPEDLFYQGLVDEIINAGFGERIAGFTGDGSFIEGDKIACKRLCKEFNIPTADEWFEVDARQWKEVLHTVLYLIDKFGGAVIKYPYSAGGKGSRIVLDSWQVREVYEQLISDYRKNYKRIFGENKKWPLLIESRMSGVEVSFTAFVDKKGNFQILPTAMDYPERFSGPASKDNPITGGMGSISPHPVETEELIEMARAYIFEPFVKALKARNILRPCILYPGCIVSLDSYLRPTRLRMCEMNIRVGEPEFQVVARRLRNLGYLCQAMFEGNLNEVQPEVRHDQVSMTIALVTGPGGPEGQKGYPWSYTVNEPVEIDFEYFRKKNIWLIPSAMQYNGKYKSAGSRVAYLIANTSVKEGESIADTTERLRKRLLDAFDAGKIRVIPREAPSGNRLDLRRDVGYHYAICEKTFFSETRHAGSKEGKAVLSYAEAGVNTEAVASGLKNLITYIRKTFNFNEFSVMLDFGYFANILNIGNNTGLAISTDGVGTKILVAQMMDKYDTVGIDCIAMNVNDILCVGAIPVCMVDYIAVESPHPSLMEEIGKGLLKGAEIAQISIPGGEIAQVREMLKGERKNFGFDLAGTAVGLVPLDRIIIGQNIKEGDIIIGFRSSGIHSNGFTLARKVLFEKGKFTVHSFVAELGKTIGEELLTPTRIYVKEIKEMLGSGLAIKALIHITGDGLLNLLRVKTDCGFIIDSLPEPQPIFKLIEEIGSVSKEEMFRVFNMGIGFCVIVSSGDVDRVFSICKKYNTECYKIGYVKGSERKIIIEKERLIGRDNKFFKL